MQKISIKEEKSNLKAKNKIEKQSNNNVKNIITNYPFNNKSGITLIALIVTIIVMLIIASISVFTIKGTGMSDKIKYTVFLHKMRSVEESITLWKQEKSIENKGNVILGIPVSGLCSKDEMKDTQRLKGEIGYYRTWNINDSMPSMDINSETSEFNSEFDGEFVYYPLGVQDLYYLDKKTLGINDKDVYLIDATNGIIYSTSGAKLKGTKCYSSYMATSIMNNSAIEPKFSASEVSGAGDDIAYADQKYLVNKDGDYVDTNGNVIDDANKVENPYGFKIISTNSTNNIFKLYNNGELYGKGIKGTQLNSSESEMNQINQYKWQKYNVPSFAKKVIVGKSDDLYFLDGNGDLYATGSNSHNKFGLTSEQQREYTGRQIVKLNVDNKKVKKVYPTKDALFIVTNDNLLYAAGLNERYQLGLGNNNTISTFTQVTNVPKDVTKIKKIIEGDVTESGETLLYYNDNTFYCVGIDTYGAFGIGTTGKTYKNFIQVWNGTNGEDIDQDIVDVCTDSCQTVILKNNGTAWLAGHKGYLGGGLLTDNAGFNKINVNNVKKMYKLNESIVFESEENNNKTFYAITSYMSACGTDYKENRSPIKLELPTALQNEGVKEVCASAGGAFIFLSNTGKIYGSGSKSWLGVNQSSGWTEKIIDLGFKNVETLHDSLFESNESERYALIFLKVGNDYYTTGNQDLMFRDKILQKSWKLIANNVSYFQPKGSAYVDKNHDLWIAGDSRRCGLGTKSATYNNIENYVKCNDSNISGKVKEVNFCGNVTYVLTTNNELWATGTYYDDTGNDNYPGWAEKEAKTSFVKILSNVKIFSIGTNDDYLTKIAFTNDGKLYVWGLNYNGLGIGTVTYNVPTQVTFPNTLGTTSNISYWLQTGSFRNFCILNNGKAYISGNWYHMFNGGNSTNDNFTEYTYGISLNSNEIFTSVVNQDVIGAIFLTNQGRLFGYGCANTLGIGNSSYEKLNCQYIKNIKDVIQIVAGNGWYVAVKKDGTVWGTGTNQYGILGRWIGIDRKVQNSRYKTAFDWVECTELEI